MSVALQSISLKNPSPSSGLSVKRDSMALCASPQFLGFESLFRRSHSYRTCISARCVYPKGLGSGFLSLDRWTSLNRPIVAFAASHEESKHSEIEVENQTSSLGAQESEEAWKQALASFKEQALKMQSVSQEAYDIYSKKAIVILKETSEQLKIQADKASRDLTVLAKEISEDSIEYLSTAAENSPEPVKDIVETFASSKDDLKDISKVRDFYFGIPYGLILSVTGFLSFMVTGSIAAIRFGVILGGALLALSISSMNSWKRGESFAIALKGQAAIASVIFLRELRLLFLGPTLFGYLASLISGSMFAFYMYRITSNGKLTEGSNLEHGTES